MNEEDKKQKVIEFLSARGPSFESDISTLCALPEAEVRVLLRADRHRFRKTGFWLLGNGPEPQWQITRIYQAEQFGRKTVPRVRSNRK